MWKMLNGTMGRWDLGTLGRNQVCNPPPRAFS